MEAFKFVIKSMVVTSLMVMLMQVKVGGTTIEEHSYRLLKDSTVSNSLQATAAGGVMALKNLSLSLKATVKQTVSGFNEGAHEKAVR
jgi:hypothetical protein